MSYQVFRGWINVWPESAGNAVMRYPVFAWCPMVLHIFLCIEPRTGDWPAVHLLSHSVNITHLCVRMNLSVVRYNLLTVVEIQYLGATRGKIMNKPWSLVL